MHQICSRCGQCLRVYLEGTNVVIEDANEKSNRIKMDMEDWKALTDKIKNGELDNLKR